MSVLTKEVERGDTGGALKLTGLNFLSAEGLGAVVGVQTGKIGSSGFVLLSPLLADLSVFKTVGLDGSKSFLIPGDQTPKKQNIN